jgi:hypothetical protein
VALPVPAIASAAASLASRGFLEDISDDLDENDERTWGLTDSGAAVVVDWVSRIVPLFTGWPPGASRVDDAVD